MNDSDTIAPRPAKLLPHVDKLVTTGQPHEQVPQVRNEPGNAHRRRIQRDTVVRTDHFQHLLNDTGHLVRVGKVTTSETSVDQVKGNCNRL